MYFLFADYYRGFLLSYQTRKSNALQPTFITSIKPRRLTGNPKEELEKAWKAKAAAFDRANGREPAPESEEDEEEEAAEDAGDDDAEEAGASTKTKAKKKKKKGKSKDEWIVTAPAQGPCVHLQYLSLNYTGVSSEAVEKFEKWAKKRKLRVSVEHCEAEGY